ncbi:DNA N-6-adenine-methyltransferase [Dyadobacter endophyticus]|uniref:DNA N-6-adenine-methyltransferase n=1 Tax=Dyadobacter endophyticus TaxID=1749036 RepID=UPI003CE917F4
MGHWENTNENDEWYTPSYIFDALGCEFDLDVAAPENRDFVSVPASKFITQNSLNVQWNGFVWMNPPFSGRNCKEQWLEKIYLHGNGIALTPDRTSAPWWPAAAKKSDALLLITGKVKFIRPNGSIAGSPGNGTTLFAYGEKAVKALINAQVAGLGLLLTEYNKQ